MSEFDLTHHAWTRYSDHYPAATEADVLREVEAAEEINRSVGDVLRGRFSTAKHDISVYRLHRQRTGMFLVDGPVVVTYFRFEISQHRQAVRMYGEGAPVDECVPWAWLVPVKRISQRRYLDLADVVDAELWKRFWARADAKMMAGA